MFAHIVSKIIVLSLLLTAVLAPAQALAAYNPLGGVDCSGPARSSTVCQSDGGDPVTGSNGVLLRVTRLLAIIAGIAAVIVMVIAGIYYITSSGDANQISQAKNTIIYAAIGLIVIVVSQGVISLIVRSI